MKELTSRQADLMLFFVAFFWGTGFAITKIALDSFTTVQFLFIRFLIASVVSFLIFNKKLKEIKKSDLKAGIIMGLFLSAGYILQTYGIQGTTAGNSAFLTGTNVVMVPFFFWFFTKIKPGKNNIIAAFLMFIGIVFLTVDFENFGKFSIYDLLSFLCAVSFAWQVVATGIFAENKDPALIATLQFFVCTIVFLFMMLLERKPITYNMEGAACMLYISLVPTLLCFLMQTAGQKYTSTTHAAIILSLEAVIGSIFGMIFLSEKYTSATVISFIFIFLAIIIAEVGYDWIFFKRNSN